MPRAARIYVLSMVLLALLFVAWSLPQLITTPFGLVTLAGIAFLTCLADAFPVIMLAERGEVTTAATVHIGSIILFGPAFTVVTTALGCLAAEIIQRRVWYKALFNVAEFVVTVSVSGIVYVRLADDNPTLFNSVYDVAALLGAGLIYYLMQETLVPIAVALAERIPVMSIWRSAFGDVTWHNLAMIPLGVMFALLWPIAPWAIGLAVLPTLAVRLSVGLVRQLRDETKQALIALADTIDARDPSTYQHSQRVAKYAEMIARQMGVPYDRLDLIVTSARLHDLGKIGMDNLMLYKPGPLSEEERAEFQCHPVIGESLVGHFPAFGAGRDLVRHHHEHFDGSGYPDGKRGQEIPRGARILAVADAYDAMTSDRPYRSAMSRETAIARLKAASGTQFAPQVVEAFLKALEKEEGEADINRLSQSRLE